jgi:hypothetical protein
MRIARGLGVLGLFSEEQVEQEHHLSKLLIRFTNQNAFKAGQGQMERKRHAKRDLEANEHFEQVNIMRHRGSYKTSRHN